MQSNDMRKSNLTQEIESAILRNAQKLMFLTLDLVNAERLQKSDPTKERKQRINQMQMSINKIESKIAALKKEMSQL
jgi:hypothetical protein